MKFSSEQELFVRIKPALSCKISELTKNNITYVREKDLYEMLKKTKWIMAKDLNLADIVSDIMNLKEDEIKEYFLSKTEILQVIE